MPGCRLDLSVANPKDRASTKLPACERRLCKTPLNSRDRPNPALYSAFRRRDTAPTCPGGSSDPRPENEICLPASVPAPSGTPRTDKSAPVLPETSPAALHLFVIKPEVQKGMQHIDFAAALLESHFHCVAKVAAQRAGFHGLEVDGDRHLYRIAQDQDDARVRNIAPNVRGRRLRPQIADAGFSDRFPALGLLKTISNSHATP